MTEQWNINPIDQSMRKWIILPDLILVP